MKVILEFSEDQQAFHNNYFTEQTIVNTNGYSTLGEIEDHKAVRFIRKIHEKYNNARLSFKTIADEFDNFK